MLSKSLVGYLFGTGPLSSITESSTCPVFNYRETGTFKVYPWLWHMLLKGHAGYLRSTLPSSSIIKSSTHPVSSRKRNFQSPPLDSPLASHGSYGLSAGNSASIFSHQIEYMPHLYPLRKRDFESLPLVAPHTLQRLCGFSTRNPASIMNHRIKYLPHL